VLSRVMLSSVLLSRAVPAGARSKLASKDTFLPNQGDVRARRAVM
jgi:hypothetical protein